MAVTGARTGARKANRARQPRRLGEQPPPDPSFGPEPDRSSAPPHGEPPSAPPPAASWTPRLPGTSRGWYAFTARVRSFDARRPWVWDLLFCALPLVAGTASVAAVAPQRPEWHDRDGLLALALLAAVVPLLFRRRFPMAVLPVSAAVQMAHSLLGVEMGVGLVVLVVLMYGSALRLPVRGPLTAWALLASGIAFTTVRTPPDDWAADYVPLISVALAATMVGLAVRARRDYLGALEERARRLEVERDQRARLAVAAERARIAREIHDIVGHNLSVVVGLADGAAFAAARHPERPAQALRAIGETTRSALTDLRRLLAVTGDDDAPAPAGLAPQPGAADLPVLVERVREAGLPVRLRTAGAPVAMSAGRELTVYRVVQEALTNALRHGGGPGAGALVSLEYGETGGVRVEVSDRRDGPPPAPPVPGAPGRGLTGMRERAAVAGGTLRAGPHAGGWLVRLDLPAEAAAAAAAGARGTSGASGGSPAPAKPSEPPVTGPHPTHPEPPV